MSSRSSFKFVTERFGLVRMATLALLAGIGAVFTGVGCGGALGGECLLDSDCQPNLICAYQFCHIPCRDSRDCNKAGEECFMSHETDKNPYNYCAIPLECSRPSDCGDSWVCAEDNKCRDKCEHDGECLKDQRCFEGSCRKAPNSDAAVVDENNIGECVGNSLPLPLEANTTLVDIGDLSPRSATLNSDGSMIYFLSYENNYNGKIPHRGIYRIPIVDGVVKSDSREAICEKFNLEMELPLDIAISSDDTTLVFTSGTNLKKIGTNADNCLGIMPIPSTQNMNPNRVAIHQRDGIDTTYFLDIAGKGYHEATSGSTPNPWTSFQGSADLAIDTTRELILDFEGHVSEVQDVDSIKFLAATGNTVYGNSGAIPAMALSETGETIYVAYSNDGWEHIMATNLAGVTSQREHKHPSKPAAVGYDVDISRARNKNLFTWVTGEGKLYLFEPL